MGTREGGKGGEAFKKKKYLVFFLLRIWWLDALQIIDKNYPKKAFELRNQYTRTKIQL